jgi:ATP-dependent RNA helicase RhlE
LNTFDGFDLIAPLKRALAQENYQTPTPIQAMTIPVALQGMDVLGCAQTGTGKTAAFALPVLHALGSRNRKAVATLPLALVLAPTRELAVQIDASFATYGQHLSLRRALVYGGVSQAQQVRALQRGVHILVATPGRLLDLIDQGHVELDRLEMFVLDEADRMLDMGFLPALKRIIKLLPDNRQSLFFSATLPPNIVQLAQQLLTDAVTVNVTPESSSVDTIEQSVMLVERGDKQARLQQVLSAAGVHRAIVFTRTKRSADVVQRKLTQQGINAGAIHGNKSQNARQRVLDSFRNNRVKVLVATDVAARGIDIDGITHVVNYDLPTEPENYVHRIGRTGRAGACGTAVTFYTSDQRAELRAIETLIGKQLAPDSCAQGSRRAGAPRAVPAAAKRPVATKRPVAAKRAGSAPADSGKRKPARQPDTTQSKSQPRWPSMWQTVD